MRKREREQVAAVARQRLERLSAELAGLRPANDPIRTGHPSTPQAPPPPGDAGFDVFGDWARPNGFRGADDRGDAAEAAATARVGGSVLAAPPRPAGWRAVGPRAEDLGPDLEMTQDPALVPPGEPTLWSAPGRHLQPRGDGAVAGWLDDRLPDALRGRIALRPHHGSVLLALVGVALAVAGWLTLQSGAHEESVPSAKLVGSTGLPTLPQTGISGRPGGTASGAVAPSGNATSGQAVGRATVQATGSVVVDVAGKVRHPGIVTLPVGSRVHDAILKAGGARHGVPLTAINLARPLVDGEQILVGARSVPAGTAPAVVGSVPAAGALVNINSAGLAELDTLPGVGPVTAQKILDWRSAHGAFTAVDDLLEVDGIGDKTLADIAPHVTL